jgi:hypothetical protein
VTQLAHPMPALRTSQHKPWNLRNRPNQRWMKTLRQGWTGSELITQTGIERPLWSSGQSTSLQIQRFRVRFPELQDFLRSSGSGSGSTQPREYGSGATGKKK